MRRIQAPGVEINEIDKSAYSDLFDESLVDTTSLVCGFADKGQDYEARYINSITLFIDIYGRPTNEAERYFYYGAKEILDNRGQLICAKLPYDNNVLDKVSYTTYKIDPNDIVEIPNAFDVLCKALPNLNLKVKDQVFPYSSFFDVMNMYELNREGFRDIARLTKTIPKYQKDLIDYVFLASNIPTEKQYAYSKYFRTDASGVFAFIRMFDYSYDILKSENLIPLNAFEVAATDQKFKIVKDAYIRKISTLLRDCLNKYEQLEPINEIDIPIDSNSDIGDLVEVATKVFDTFGMQLVEDIHDGTNGNLLLWYMARSFVMQKTLFDIKDYFYDLYDMIAPIFDDIKDDVHTDITYDTSETLSQCQHHWKINFANLSNYIDNENDILANSYSDIRTIDSTLTSYIKIKSIPAVLVKYESNNTNNTVRAVSSYSATGLMSIDELDNLKIGKTKVAKNTFKIIDISRTNYGKDADNTIECAGILPVVTTAMNALYFQQLDTTKTSVKAFNAFSKMLTVYDPKYYNDTTLDKYYDTYSNEFLFDLLIESNTLKNSYNDIAVGKFPALNFTAANHIDKNYLKLIGIVVFKVTKATSTNKLQLIPLESFVGSLDYNSHDLNTKAENFIDHIVNDNSKYINVFSNFEFNLLVGYETDEDESPLDAAMMYFIKDLTATSLGFYEKNTLKTIGLKNSIYRPLDRVFEQLKNIDTTSIDIVVDAGISTIAQYIASKAIKNEFSKSEDAIDYYDAYRKNGVDFNVMLALHTQAWKTILQKYDNFCKNVRRDCMFIADALRPTCITANLSNMRTTSLTATLKTAVIDKLKYLINLNTSYGAGYCNWCYAYDDYAGIYFWCPPSIKAAGKYIYTDIYFNYWDAPAGLSRGVLENIFGLAFNPTNEEAGFIYNKSWNYAVQYPLQGFILEGQRTFLIDKTAFDRVNVRRLFLKMEKLVYRIAKRFCYEGNTPYMRLRFVDTIRPIFEEAVQGSGISEYVIICDERNNKTINIENHELHCTIAVRPVKTIEFIVLNFIAMPLSGSFTEETILNMTPYYS